MSDKKHELLLILAALTAAACLLLYSVFDSPKYNSLEAVPVSTRAPATYPAASTAAAHGKININTAGLSELSQLELIGEAKAQAIIEYRERNGFFRTPEELTNVSGISDTILNKNIDRITV